MNNSIIAPSVLNANFLNLKDEITAIEKGGAGLVHLDIMDGHFVPNISFGFPVMEAMKRHARKPLDVHLMIERPEKFIPEVQRLGALVMNVHQEACVHLHRVLQQIRNAGMMSGVTLNPSTPVSMVEDVLEEADLVMLMSVNPGFAGQRFIEHTYEKVERLREMIDRRHLPTLIEVDGGVCRENAARLYEAGADVLVAGSAVFRAQNPVEEVDILKNC